MNTLFIGLIIILGSFVLSFVVAPTTLMFNKMNALIIYALSWLLFVIGVLIGGKVAYINSISGLKKWVKRRKGD
ncbi:hypothetical protein J4418_01145 [Candidatus Woesearchaeota archaeon]|nr:hypothetical protein [Candidatus Woesearchaeota archaeon]